MPGSNYQNDRKQSINKFFLALVPIPATAFLNPANSNMCKIGNYFV